MMPFLQPLHASARRPAYARDIGCFVSLYRYSIIAWLSSFRHDDMPRRACRHYLASLAGLLLLDELLASRPR